ncbi:hypothetical protein DB347_20765 [Opitutaceae bacterium EW11]|nr:hypothetical protein DB347_20765 [Opitutaceae bacterium EW11]
MKELFVSSIRHKPITLAPPLDGSVDAPAGLHWGLSIDELVAGLKNRGAVLEQKTKEAGKTVVTLRGGSFGGQTVDLWTASFVDSGLFELSIQFYSATSDTMNIFRTVQKSLVGKYGKPNVIQDHGFSRLNLNADYSERLHDYYAADGRFWRALNNLQADYAHGVANDALQVVARWAYKNSDKITLHAVGNSDVLLVYTNGVGASQKSSVNAAEAAKDF